MALHSATQAEIREVFGDRELFDGMWVGESFTREEPYDCGWQGFLNRVRRLLWLPLRMHRVTVLWSAGESGVVWVLRRVQEEEKKQDR